MTQDISVIQGDRAETSHPKTPIVIILDRLRSAHNVGNIFRLADAVNAREVICCGYTATPPHPKLEKTAMGTDQMVDFRHFETAEEAAKTLKTEGYKIIAVETAESAVDYDKLELNSPTAFIMGNEALGISQEALAQCDAFTRLPAIGRKNSINVSNCAAVVLFHAASQLRG